MTINVEVGEQSMKGRKRMTKKAEERAENEREEAYDHKCRGGRAEYEREKAYDQKSRGESRA